MLLIIWQFSGNVYQIKTFCTAGGTINKLLFNHVIYIVEWWKSKVYMVLMTLQAPWQWQLSVTQIPQTSCRDKYTKLLVFKILIDRMLTNQYSFISQLGVFLGLCIIYLSK